MFSLAHPLCLFDNERSLRVQRNDEFTGSCGFLELVKVFLDDKRLRSTVMSAEQT